MTVGFIILAHQDLDRAAEVAAYLARNDAPVVIHVDARTREDDFNLMKSTLSRHENIRFSKRFACDWGKYSIVQATQEAAEILLRDFADVTHVFLASGSCLPLRPMADLNAYLAEFPATDFIESVTTEEVSWTIGGLDLERFTLRFPFSWKKRRRMFDRYVNLQRKIGYSRRIPRGVEPHLGSQWWCLTRATLTLILRDPQRKEYDRYFSKVWIPDEAYFQSLVRKHAVNIESRSLTLSRFDYQGKPHVFYDDHLPLLLRSDCFVARKIWPRADKLYNRFLSEQDRPVSVAEPNPRKIDRIFQRANEQRTRGRTGRRMQSRFPTSEVWSLQKTCAPYSVYEGFSEIFSNFENWLEKRTGSRVHGRLFHKAEVKFSGGAEVLNGCLSNSAKLRDYNPVAFLENLIWNTQGEHQSFQFGPADRQDITRFIASDQNARVLVITGAWSIPLLHSRMEFHRIRAIAARYQATEAAHVAILKSRDTRAEVKVWTLAEFIEDPMTILQSILDGLEPGLSRKLTEVPKMADLTDLGQFVQRLKNEGMNPHSVGDIPLGSRPPSKKAPPKPYVVR